MIALSTAVADPASRRAGPVARGKFRILLVDSNLSLCTSVSRTLAGLGYGLDVAYDGEEARLLAVQHHYTVAVIGESLSDGDGVGLFRELCRLQRGLLGVLVTTVARLESVVRAIDGGMSRVLAVPLDFRDLTDFLVAIQPPGPAVPANGIATAGASAGTAATKVYSETEVAELSSTDIAERLSVRELIDVIRSVEYPFAGKERLEHFDRDTLERVVHLVRRWCRNRLQRPAW